MDQEATKAERLRTAWALGDDVVVTLSERCAPIRRLEGRVQQVAVTGAFAIVDGWQVLLEDVLDIGGKP